MKKLTSLIIALFLTASINAQLVPTQRTLLKSNALELKAQESKTAFDKANFDRSKITEIKKQGRQFASGKPAKTGELLNEGFEGTTGTDIPDGWERDGTAASISATANGAWITTGTNARTGSRTALINLNSSGNTGDGGILWSPNFTLESGATYKIEFWIYWGPGTNTTVTDALIVDLVKGELDGEDNAVIETIVDVGPFQGQSPMPQTTWTRFALNIVAPETGNDYYLEFFAGNVYLMSNGQLPGYRGGNIRIDDISIDRAKDNDLKIIANFPYTQIPALQFLPSATAKNNGIVTQTNVRLSATLDAAYIGQSNAVASIAPEATSDLMSIPQATPPAIGNHTMVLTVSGDQTNEGTDSTATFVFNATENVFATDILTGPAANGVGFNESTATFATVFEVTKATVLSGVQLLFSQQAGTPVYTVEVYKMTGPLSTASTPVASKEQNRVPGAVTVDFTDVVVLLDTGFYAVCLTQTGGENILISYDESATGGWYQKSNNDLLYNEGGQGFGALGIRMIIDNNAEIPVKIVSTTPANDAIDIDLDAEVKATFNQDITAGILTGVTFNPDATGVSASVVGRDLIIAHDDFEPGTEYTVNIPAGTIEGYDSVISWTFRTRFTEKDLPDPYDLAVNVAGTDATLTWIHGVEIGTPYSEGFEETTGTNLPTGWTRSTGTIAWKGVNNNVEGVVAGQGENPPPSDIPPHSGTRQMARSWQNTGGNTWAFSEGIGLIAGVQYAVKFWYAAPGYPPSEYDAFKVQIAPSTTLTGTGASAQMTDGTTIFSNTNQNINAYTLCTYNFTPTVTRLHYLGFHDMTPGQKGLYIIVDDISITTEETIIPENAAESFNIFLNGDSVANVTDMQYAFTNLTPGSYTAGVQAVGEAGLSNIIPINFTVVGPVELVSKTPKEDTTGVARNAEVKVTFNQNITAGTLTGITFTPNVAGVSASISGADLIIAHNQFANNTVYTVNIPAGVVAGYDSVISWSFTVGNIGPLKVVSKTPRDGATGVSRTAQVKVTFNQNITADTLIDITFTPNVTGVLTNVRDFDLIISHDMFEYDTVYTVNIPAGVVVGYDSVITWSFTIIGSAGIEVLDGAGAISIYPNPVSDILYIKSTEIVKQIEVLSVDGKLLKTVTGAVNELPVRDLRSGVYILRITTNKGVAIKRIIKN